MPCHYFCGGWEEYYSEGGISSHHAMTVMYILQLSCTYLLQRRCCQSSWSGFGRTTFPANLIIISHACVVTRNLCWIVYADSAMASVSRPSSGPTLKLHTSQDLFLSRDTDHLQALPSVVHYNGGPYHFFYAAAAPVLHVRIVFSWATSHISCLRHL